jgi:hypothetical protein
MLRVGCLHWTRTSTLLHFNRCRVRHALSDVRLKVEVVQATCRLHGVPATDHMADTRHVLFMHVAAGSYVAYMLHK